MKLIVALCLTAKVAGFVQYEPVEEVFSRLCIEQSPNRFVDPETGFICYYNEDCEDNCPVGNYGDLKFAKISGTDETDGMVSLYTSSLRTSAPTSIPSGDRRPSRAFDLYRGDGGVTRSPLDAAPAQVQVPLVQLCAAMWGGRRSVGHDDLGRWRRHGTAVQRRQVRGPAAQGVPRPGHGRDRRQLCLQPQLLLPRKRGRPFGRFRAPGEPDELDAANCFVLNVHSRRPLMKASSPSAPSVARAWSHQEETTPSAPRRHKFPCVLPMRHARVRVLPS